MPSPAWEDLDDFLDPDEFGVQCVVTSSLGVARPAITVIFDDPDVTARAGEYERDDRYPRAMCKETDLVGVKRGDSCVMTFKNPDKTTTAQTYDVMKTPESTGDGMATLVLSKRVASER